MQNLYKIICYIVSVFGYRDEDEWYDVMQVCIKGHQITTSLRSDPNDGQNYCDLCGSKTISKCLKCDADIRGYHHYPNIAYCGSIPVPRFCHECGAKYPWSGIFNLNKRRFNINRNKNFKKIFNFLPIIGHILQIFKF